MEKQHCEISWMISLTTDDRPSIEHDLVMQQRVQPVQYMYCHPTMARCNLLIIPLSTEPCAQRRWQNNRKTISLLLPPLGRRRTIDWCASSPFLHTSSVKYFLSSINYCLFVFLLMSVVFSMFLIMLPILCIEVVVYRRIDIIANNLCFRVHSFWHPHTVL